jgi:hypothetical protein
VITGSIGCQELTTSSDLGGTGRVSVQYRDDVESCLDAERMARVGDRDYFGGLGTSSASRVQWLNHGRMTNMTAGPNCAYVDQNRTGKVKVKNIVALLQEVTPVQD